MASDQKIDVGLSFNGDKAISLSTKDADYKQLLEVMFRNTAAWGATWNAETGAVTLKPAAGVGKVDHPRESFHAHEG